MTSARAPRTKGLIRHHSSSPRGPRPRPSDTTPPSNQLRHPHPPTLPTPWKSVPHLELPAKSVDRGEHGKWVAWCRPGLRSRAGMPRRTRKPQRRTRVGSSGEVCAVTDQAPGQRAPTPGGRGQAPTRRQDSSRSPCRCCQACWRRVVSSTTSRATALLSEASRVAMSATDHRPIPRPGTVHRSAAG